MKLIINKLSKKKSVPVQFGTDLSYEINELTKTLLSLGGVGLSAPQMGDLRSYFIMSPNFSFDSVKVIINPKIDYMSTNKNKMAESCLSFPGKFRQVRRSLMIHCEYYDENWELHKTYFRDFQARVFLHEYEHLEGKSIF